MTMFPAPASILYQVAKSDLMEVFREVYERGFKDGQKVPIDDPITRKEAAKYLKCNVSTLDKWVKEGVLDSAFVHRKGGTVYFLKSELHQFIKE